MTPLVFRNDAIGHAKARSMTPSRIYHSMRRPAFPVQSADGIAVPRDAPARSAATKASSIRWPGRGTVSQLQLPIVVTAYVAKHHHTTEQWADEYRR
jgi:hypothetical protein